MLEPLTDANFLIYAMKHYDNPQCHSTEEFYDDLKRIKYIKKLLTRYVDTGELKERLILNHVIVLTNVFGPEAAVRILFLKLRGQLHLIKPFLVMLDVLPDFVFGIDKTARISTVEIEMEPQIVAALRKI